MRPVYPTERSQPASRFGDSQSALSWVGNRSAALERQIQQGFPFLPSGSQLVLDRVAQQIVLDSVRQQLRLTRKGLAGEVRSYGDLLLAQFLTESRRELVDIYRGNSSWTDVRRLAGLPTAATGPDEAPLLRRLSSLLHVDDPERAETYALLMSDHAPHYDALTPRQQRLAHAVLHPLAEQG